MRSVRSLDPFTPALPLPPVLLRCCSPLSKPRLARLPGARCSLQQQFPLPLKLPLLLVLPQQFRSYPLLQLLQLWPVRRLRLQPPRVPRPLRFHPLGQPQKRSHKIGSRPGRFCPPSFRRYPESPSIVRGSSTRVFPRN